MKPQPPMESDTKLPRARVCANGRRYATAYSSFVGKTANPTAEVKYDGASRGTHAAYFHIHVSAKALSGASDEIGILRVRRSILPRCVVLNLKD